MDWQDGRDPFDRQTYYSENGLTIATMVELRVFCAAFFERHVRHNTRPVGEEMMAQFIKLITHSDFFFARARAVIPELQVPNTILGNENVNIRRVLLETRKFRGPPGKKWSILPDESAWSKLSSEGRALLEKQIKEDRKQSGDASNQAPVSISKGSGVTAHGTPASNANALSPLSKVPREVGEYAHKNQVSNLNAQTSLTEDAKVKRNLELIPIFVPQNASGSQQLVWSPTSGSRQRRPTEKYQTSAASATPRYSGSELSPSHETAPIYNIDTLPRSFRKLRTTSPIDSLPLSPILRTKATRSPFGPIAPGSAPRKMQPQQVDDLLGSPKLTTFHMSDRDVHQEPRHGGCLSPFCDPSTIARARYPVNRTRGVPGVEPFSAPPNMNKFQGRHDSGQGRYSTPRLVLQPPSGPKVYSPITNAAQITPSPDIWGLQRSAQPPAQHLALSNPVTLEPGNPEFGFNSMAIPLRGSMSPIEYWDMLYQLENEFRASLAAINQPMSGIHRHYIAQLEQVRMTAIRTRLPNRRRDTGTKKWLLRLEMELYEIWRRRPGQMEDPPIVIARKRDYERVVAEEIEKARLEC